MPFWGVRIKDFSKICWFQLFWQNISIFWQIVPLLKAIVWDFLVLFSVFVNKKVCFYRLCIWTGFWIALNWALVGKMTMTSQFLDRCYRQVFLMLWFFLFFFSFLVKFSYWSKSHVNIITVSGVMNIYVF